MSNFGFRKLNNPPRSDGTVRISGPLLEQLRALEPGQVLQLDSHDETYAVVRWEDILKGVRLAQP